MLHHIDDIDYTKCLKLAEGGQTRGHTLKLVKQSRLRQCVLGIHVVNDMKSLDEAVVMADSVNAFKTGLEASWKEKDFKYDATGYYGLPSVGVIKLVSTILGLWKLLILLLKMQLGLLLWLIIYVQLYIISELNV